MVVATGFFDGVHLGHRIVIEALVRAARERGTQSVVVTFWPHPRNVLQNDARGLRLLSSFPEKEAMLRQLGVDRVFAGLLPAQKVEQVEKLLAEGRRVAFVGDGINDAPVLSRADVGIAMGAMGSDAAIESADIVLMDDKPSRLPLAKKIARRTMRIVHENIIFALAVKFGILFLSAAGLTSMWWAVFGDVGVLILAILNAMRCLLPVKDG